MEWDWKDGEEVDINNCISPWIDEKTKVDFIEIAKLLSSKIFCNGFSFVPRTNLRTLDKYHYYHAGKDNLSTRINNHDFNLNSRSLLFNFGWLSDLNLADPEKGYEESKKIITGLLNPPSTREFNILMNNVRNKLMTREKLKEIEYIENLRRIEKGEEVINYTEHNFDFVDQDEIKFWKGTFFGVKIILRVMTINEVVFSKLLEPVPGEKRKKIKKTLPLEIVEMISEYLIEMENKKIDKYFEVMRSESQALGMAENLNHKVRYSRSNLKYSDYFPLLRRKYCSISDCKKIANLLWWIINTSDFNIKKLLINTILTGLGTKIERSFRFNFQYCSYQFIKYINRAFPSETTGQYSEHSYYPDYFRELNHENENSEQLEERRFNMEWYSNKISLPKYDLHEKFEFGIVHRYEDINNLRNSLKIQIKDIYYETKGEFIRKEINKDLINTWKYFPTFDNKMIYELLKGCDNIYSLGYDILIISQVEWIDWVRTVHGEEVGEYWTQMIPIQPV